MSDSDRDEIQDARISACLRKTVAEQFKANREAITVRLIRNEVEKELGLDEGYLKTDSHWKDESRAIIVQEVDIQQASADDAPQSPKKASPKKQKVERKPAAKKAKAKRAVSDDEAEKPESPKVKKKAPPKTASPKKASPKKPTQPPAAAPESSDLSELDGSLPKKQGRAATTKSRPSKRARVEDEESAEKEPTETPPEPLADDSGDESEMSVVNDDPLPNQKKRRTKGVPAEPKKKTKAAAKVAAKPRKEKAPAKELSLDDEKIKTLQGQLLKCGIRKIWSRELAKYDTPKEKIKHLKQLLADVGMTGQFSLAKAKKIKDERELQAEVAAIQQSAGYASDDDGKTGTRSRAPAAGAATPKRRLARGLDSLDFLGDQSDSD